MLRGAARGDRRQSANNTTSPAGILGLGLTGWCETARAGLKAPPLTLAEPATVWSAKVLTAPGTSLQPVESVKAGVCTLAWDAHTRERFLGWVDQRRTDRAEGDTPRAAARSAPVGEVPLKVSRGQRRLVARRLAPVPSKLEREAPDLISSWASTSGYRPVPDRLAGGQSRGREANPPGRAARKEDQDRRLEVDKALSRLLRLRSGYEGDTHYCRWVGPCPGRFAVRALVPLMERCRGAAQDRRFANNTKSRISLVQWRRRWRPHGGRLLRP